ncbi:hypothetical protein TNCV_325131 [Trichonephila clavipes]|nr:hypothetical protein TNCV_325131 [Trichonephila clavipes]
MINESHTTILCENHRGQSAVKQLEATVYLVRLERNHLLRVASAWPNTKFRSLLSTTGPFEDSDQSETARIGQQKGGWREMDEDSGVGYETKTEIELLVRVLTALYPFAPNPSCLLVCSLRCHLSKTGVAAFDQQIHKIDSRHGDRKPGLWSVNIAITIAIERSISQKRRMSSRMLGYTYTSQKPPWRKIPN